MSPKIRTSLNNHGIFDHQKGAFKIILMMTSGELGPLTLCMVWNAPLHIVHLPFRPFWETFPLRIVGGRMGVCKWAVCPEMGLSQNQGLTTEGICDFLFVDVFFKINTFLIEFLNWIGCWDMFGVLIPCDFGFKSTCISPERNFKFITH